MGLVSTQITLRNPLAPHLRSLQLECTVDTGAMHLCMPEHVAIQLGYDLSLGNVREVTVADGRKIVCKYVGPVQVEFKNRSCFVGALVLGDQVLLGAVPMEDLDLVVIPSQLKVDVNPASPNIPSSVVK